MKQDFKKHELFEKHQAAVLDEFYIYNDIKETKYLPKKYFLFN